MSRQEQDLDGAMVRRPQGRRRVTRRMVATWLGAAGAAWAAACGPGAPGEQPSAQSSAPVTIVAWLDSASYGTATFAPIHEAQLALFRQASPQVTVRLESGDLQTSVVAGTPPDIMRTNYTTMYTYQKQGVVEPIDAYLDRRGKADFYDWPREISTIDGKMFEWPWMLNPVGPIVNRSLFKQKSLDHLVPQPGAKADWTFDQWRAALKAISAVSGDPEKDVFGTAWAAKTTTGDYYLMMYQWSNGAELYDKDQTRVTINSPEGIAALQMLVEVVARDRVAVPDPWNYDTVALRPLYQRKQLAILNGAPSDIGDVEAGLRSGSIIAPFEAQFMPVPHAPGKKPITYIATNTFVVFKQSGTTDRTRAAMRLGFQMTDNAAQQAIVPLGQLPVRKSVGNIYPNDVNRTTALSTINDGREQGRHPNVGDIRTLYNTAVRDALEGTKSPKDALDEMVRLSVPVMARNAGR